MNDYRWGRLSVVPDSEEERLQDHRVYLWVIGFMILVSVFTGAVLYRAYVQNSVRLAEERKVAAEVARTKAVIDSILSSGAAYDAWNGGKPIRDAWDVDLRIEESQFAFFYTIRVASAGPDLTFSTKDDITAESRYKVSFQKTIEDPPSLKDLYRRAKQRIVGKPKELLDAPTDSYQGSNP